MLLTSLIRFSPFPLSQLEMDECLALYSTLEVQSMRIAQDPFRSPSHGLLPLDVSLPVFIVSRFLFVVHSAVVGVRAVRARQNAGAECSAASRPHDGTASHFCSLSLLSSLSWSFVVATVLLI